MTKTLEQLVLTDDMYQCTKHRWAPDPVLYAQDELNKLTNAEFLTRLSAAITVMLNPTI